MSAIFAHLPRAPLPDISARRIFISYARKDNRKPPDYKEIRDDDPITELQTLLTERGFHVWRDLHDIEGGESWWKQIQEAIDKSGAVIVCLSPHWLESEVARKERLYALEEGKPVLPILIADLPANRPAWVDDEHYHDVRQSNPYHLNEWNKFCNELAQPQARTKVAFMVEQLPLDYVERPQELQKLAQALVGDKTALGITTAFKGSGGYGKTMLARALCHLPVIREHYRDGILWVQLKENVDDSWLIEQARKVIERLGLPMPTLNKREDVRDALKDAIGEKRILVVVDDAWERAALEPFLGLGPKSATLVTTRNAHILPQEAVRQNVDEMRQEECRQMLLYKLDWDEETRRGQEKALDALAQRLGRWALLLKLTNKQLFLLKEMGMSPPKMLETINEALDSEGFSALDDPDNPNIRHQAAAACLAVSLRQLKDDERSAFARLAIFPDDADIPLKLLDSLWGTKQTQTLRFVMRFDGLSLLLLSDLDAEIIRLHDVVRQHLREQNAAHLRSWNEEWLGQWKIAARFDPDSGKRWEPYLWRNLAYHLLEAGAAQTLYNLLTDFRYWEAKVAATDALALVADCEAYQKAGAGDGAAQKRVRLLRHTLILSLPALAEDRRLLGGQALARTEGAVSDEGLSHWRKGIVEWGRLRYVRAAPPLSQAGGALLAVFEHGDEVEGAIELSDRTLLSWSEDGTLRRWSADGVGLAAFAGHRYGMKGAVELSDGTLLSWSWDGTLRRWSADGVALAVFEHGGWVEGAVELSDGTLLSWSNDRTLRRWSVDGVALSVFAGHRYGVEGAVELSDGTLLSWSNDRTLRRWSVDGVALSVFAGHRYGVKGAIELSDRTLLSWSWDRTLRRWSADGVGLAAFAGHRYEVKGAVELSDGTLLSWSNDGTLRRWSADGVASSVFAGHGDWVKGAIELSDRTLLSWSFDRTLRRWSVDGVALSVFAGHRYGVEGAVELSDGTLLSWSNDRTLRRWSVDGVALAVFAGHGDWVKGAVELSDGTLLSWSRDGTLRRWSADGVALSAFAGHGDSVLGAVELSDGTLLSWSGDGTLRRWSADGVALSVFAGHGDWVKGAVELSDGTLLSWSNDRTLRRWSADGVELAAFAGHKSRVKGAVELSDGTLLSWSFDRTLRRWSVDGVALAAFAGHKSRVEGAVELSDGTLLSWSFDRTLRRWSVDGVALAAFAGYGDSVLGAVELSDGTLLSWSEDGTLRRWSADGVGLAAFAGHRYEVKGAVELSDGTLLSWSRDGTLRRWSVDGVGLAVFAGHKSRVEGAVELSDGTLLSWSGDRTLRRWSVDGEPLAVLEEPLGGNTERLAAWARAQGFDPGALWDARGDRLIQGLRASYWGPSVIVYEPGNGQVVGRFRGDADVASLALAGEVVVAVDRTGRMLFLRLSPSGG